MREELGKLFDGAVVLCTTKAVLRELETLGEAFSASRAMAKRLRKVAVTHVDDAGESGALSPAQSILSIVKSRGSGVNYSVATQDSELRQQLREMGGVCVLFSSYNVISKALSLFPCSLYYAHELRGNHCSVYCVSLVIFGVCF